MSKFGGPVGRSARVLGVAALACAGLFVSPIAGQSHAADKHGCPEGAMCVYPGPDYQGEPRVLGKPHWGPAKATWLDDGHCLHMPVGSVVDNTIYGATFYANDLCDDGGDYQSIKGRDKVSKFSSWKVRSLVFPLDYPVD